MRIEPRLTSGLEGERRERVLKRAAEALALAQAQAQSGQAGQAAQGAIAQPLASHVLEALQILGAMAMLERRWGDALSVLDTLGADQRLSPAERARFLIAAGDIAAQRMQNRPASRRFYGRARELVPTDSRLVGLAKPDEAERAAANEGDGSDVTDVTDEMLV
jgi:hypothetical protein